MKTKSQITTLLSLLFLLLLLTPLTRAMAQAQTWEIRQSMETSYCRAWVFDGELPPGDFRAALDANGFSGCPVYKGAMLVALLEEDGVALETSARGFLAVETGAGRTLLYLEQEEGADWRVMNLGAKCLLSGRAFSITIADINQNPYRTLGSRFLIQYAREGGGMESYGLWADWNGLPYVATYESVDQKGNGFAILNSYSDYGFRIRSLPLEKDGAYSFDPENEEFYPAYVPLWLEYMDAITDYPTSEAGAQHISQESVELFTARDLAMAYGAHLREEATAQSKSLGTLSVGVLVRVLEQAKGRHAPWYHVKFGEMEGWISGDYVKFPKNRDFWETMWHTPLTVAQTLQARTLYAAPRDNAQAVAQLPEGALMHVALECPGGWLYVMVPRGELSWEMDVEGTGGFLRAEWVEQAASAGMLTPRKAR